MSVVTAALVGDVVAGPLFSLKTKTWPAERQGDKLVAAIEGVVKGIDAGTATVRVASGFLGLGSRAVVIEPQSSIAVADKLGALADLERGQRVRVAYEILPGRLVASRVTLLGHGTAELPFPSDPLPEPGPVPAPVTPPPAEKPAPVAPPPSLASSRPATPSAPAPTAPKPPAEKNGAAASKKRPVKPRVSSPRPRPVEARRPETTPVRAQPGGTPDRALRDRERPAR